MMEQQLVNPFNVTKANDLDDQGINDTWVDLSNDGGFGKLANLTSPVPMLLLGGKGSGRTHLMRYFSYELQKIRSERGDIVETIHQDGYLGVYLRCEGLNAGRFEGKNQTDETWAMIFSYYMDLWLSCLVLDIVQDAVGNRNEFKNVEATFCQSIINLFDIRDFKNLSSLKLVIETIKGFIREIDYSVNNAAVTLQLKSFSIRATRGRLVFGIPQLIREHISAFSDILILYLIDELENLTENQQLYLNTLIREKRSPVSFKVGSRLHGFRTRRTLSAGEENREGSEYELLYLDERLRSDPRYPSFARGLVLRRLAKGGYIDKHKADRLLGQGGDNPDLIAALERYFENIPKSPFERAATEFIVQNYEPGRRPYLTALRDKLTGALAQGQAPGVSSEEDIQMIMNSVCVTDTPLIEKANTMMLYQDWASQKNLVAAAEKISNSAKAILLGDDEAGVRHKRMLGHFTADLLAQILREARQRQRYLGLNTFIEMSGGLPRHLLIILKHIFNSASFNGEEPFFEKPVSMRSQQEAILYSSNWFFENARTVGSDTERVQESIERLANLFHRLRFSDKPVESSLVTFSFTENLVSKDAREILEQAEQNSLILRVVGGQKDRNTSRVDAKYQINPMLSPRFDLPLGRRGVIALSPIEIDAIFGSVDSAPFKEISKVRIDRMTAPFTRKKSDTSNANDGMESNELQPTLPGFVS